MYSVNLSPPPSLRQESPFPKTPSSLNVERVDDYESMNARFSFLSLTPPSYQKKHYTFNTSHALFGHNKKKNTNHIDLKSLMPPINTSIDMAPSRSFVHDDIESIDDSVSLGSITKGFIDRFSSIAHFRPIRPITPLLSFEKLESIAKSTSRCERRDKLPEDRHLSFASDDDLCTIQSDDDIDTDAEDDDDHTGTITENTEHSRFIGLHPLQFGSMTHLAAMDSENWSINTPTTNYTRFKLYGAIAMSPFQINKNSFKSLQTKAKLRTNKSYASSYALAPGMIPKMTTYQTIFTVVNVYVNNTILFNSYALMRGGLFAVCLFGLLCIWLCYTGKLMVHALCCNTAPTLYTHMGWWFSFMMSVVIVLENIGRTIICLVTMWQNILYIVRDPLQTDGNDYQLQANIAMISSAVLLLPTAWMLFFSDLVFDSILGFISTWSLALIVIANFVVNTRTDVDAWHNTEIGFWPQDISGLVLCFGIFIANMAGHSCLPTIYNQMQDPSQYSRALNVSWVVIFVIEMTTGIFGYCTYGSNTKLMITESMMETSVPNEPRHILFTVLTICVVINLFVHVPIGVAIASQLPESVLQLKHHLIRRVFRTVFFIVIVYTAWLCLGQIALLSAFIGSILTLTISMLCPLLAKVYLDVQTNKHKNVFIGIVVVLFTSCSIFMLFILFHFDISG
eukprot:1019551_1